MTTSSRGEALFSVGVLPSLMGLGHLAPVVGSIYATTGGELHLPVPLLLMIGTASALVDSYDTYKDLPLEKRPRRWLWKAWIYSLWAIVFLGTFLCGYETSIRMYRFSLIGLLWGTPCVPIFSQAKMSLFKPKTVFREFKSLVVAVCMGIITSDTPMFHQCHNKGAVCSDNQVQTRALLLAVLYQFFRETVCDIRDMEEDVNEGIDTLPLRLGKYNTVLFLTVFGSIADAFLTGGAWFDLSSGSRVSASFHIQPQLVMQSVVRVELTMDAFTKILEYPRENNWAWGTASLLGLVPVLSAHAALAGTT